ncbi:hypothetical protein [Sporisorium scitamineum]|uniref:Effector protein n=1 Tax=Sporisorium scitamineum TaxID=49012 RepID=A0A0F7S2X6_9BASI|nr:hypothetical protein [Sporisorium scitamineum]
MNLLPTFAALLLVLQVITAIHSDQLQQPRFAKVKRTVSGHAAGNKAYRLGPGPNLKKRGKVELVKGLDELGGFVHENADQARQARQPLLIEEIGGPGARAGDKANVDIAKLYGLRPARSEFLEGETSRAAEQRGDHRDFAQTQEWRDHQNKINWHTNILDDHSRALGNHYEAIQKAHERIDGIPVAPDVTEFSDKLNKIIRNGRIKSNLLWTALATSLTVGGVATFSAISSNNALEQEANTNRHLSEEVARLKAQNAQQLPTSVNGPGGVPAVNRGPLV